MASYPRILSRPAVVLPGVLLVTAVLASPPASSPAAPSETRAGPRSQDWSAPEPAGVGARGLASAASTPTVHEFRFPEPRTASLRPGRHAVGLVAMTPPKAVSGYGVVGATWEGPRPAGMHLAVRTRDGAGAWSRWQALHGEDASCETCAAESAASEHGPDPGTAELGASRPGTDALAIGRVDQVQFRMTSRSGRMPRDLLLSLVDPRPTITRGGPVPPTRASGAASGGPAATGLGDPQEPSAELSAPEILTRAEWGADETLRSREPYYGTVQVGFVHHTVNANDYTQEDVPAIIRGIYAYHTESRGWSDIGYNFLVDRFGRIWEGRYGGVDRPVVGAHTYGYNDVSFAMSAIGNFEETEPTEAMLDAYAELFAWKLSLHDIRLPSMQELDGTKFRAISGHSDAGSTACPGLYLYGQLPEIRARAAAIQGAAPPEQPNEEGQKRKDPDEDDDRPSHEG